jgi:hypothetical protein
MNYIKKAWHLFDNYLLARWLNRPSTALFWYLPEPLNVLARADLARYQQATPSPFYFIDYRKKLAYSLENREGIIVLPYQEPIGNQVNPEAAFQYALALHDQFLVTKDPGFRDKFWLYIHYFYAQQNPAGLWAYHFDWHGSKAPWYSALAQARGASVMLRAWLLSGEKKYLTATKNALALFRLPIEQGGFLHRFKPCESLYYEEYPQTPTGVLNGFMSSLINIWEVRHWLQEKWADELWTLGLTSLQSMLPYYSMGWWSLYDLDANTPIANVNSPRYHLLEMNYLRVLSLLSKSNLLENEYQKRVRQYHRFRSRIRAYSMKLARKILYK